MSAGGSQATQSPSCVDCASVKCFPWRDPAHPEIEHFVWLCGYCKYLRDHPDAERMANRRARRLQKETLF